MKWKNFDWEICVEAFSKNSLFIPAVKCSRLRLPLRPQGGSEGQILSKVILKDLVEIKKMLKFASKNIIPSPRY